MSNAETHVRNYMTNSNADVAGDSSITSDAIEEFAGYFDKEAFEMQLLEMENALINNSDNKSEVVQGLFRDMHSLKGSSAMLKIDPMTHLLHNLEDVLGAISKNVLSISAVKKTEIFDFFLQGFDLIERLVHIFRQDPAFVLKNSREMFGFYIRVINESRSIVATIDEYMEISEVDENMF